MDDLCARRIRALGAFGPSYTTLSLYPAFITSGKAGGLRDSEPLKAVWRLSRLKAAYSYVTDCVNLYYSR